MGIALQHHESALGRWVQGTCRPESLGGLVDSIWYFDGHILESRERIFPAGLIEMNVHLGATYGQVREDAVTPFPAVCLSGLLLRSAVVQGPPEPTTVIGVRLFPAGASLLLGHPVHELTDITVNLGDVVAAAAVELQERCAAAAGPERRVNAVVAWLEQRAACAFARQRPVDAAVIWAAREIERQGGALSIDGLRERTGWSKSRFAVAFREAVGVPPKHLARMVRFRRALELVNADGLASSSIALRCGYYDQAHFNAEFREFTGTTPGEYRAARRYPASVNVVESQAMP